MNHSTEIIETKELNDEQVAYRVRCCGDPSTDSWHTASVAVDHRESLKAHCERVQSLHESKILWRQQIAKSN